MDIKGVKATGAILVNQNEPLIIGEINFPEKLEVGQVFVELHTSGICGSQIGEVSGVKGEDKFLPHLMGHEGCGTVIAIGEGVKTVKAGDLVVLHWRKGSGIQSDTPKYNWKGQKLNAGWVTTFNTHGIISENRCTKIPKNTNKDYASLFGCAITTGFGVIENNAKLKMGESIVVYGAGGVGLNIIQAAKLTAAYPIIAVDLFESRLDMAKKAGATHLLKGEVSEVAKKIKMISNDIDVFVDNTGLTEIMKSGYELLSNFGRLILVGVPKKNDNLLINTLPLHFGKKIIGSHGGESNPEIDIPRYLKLHNQKLLSLKDFITTRYPLAKINNAIDDMRKGISAGRIIIDL